MELWQKSLVFCILLIFYCRGEKPAIGYTLTNDRATKDNWVGSYLNFPVRDLTLCFWYKFTDLSDIEQDHNILSAATPSTTNFFLIRFFTRFLELDVDWLGQMMTVSHSFSPDLNIWTYYCLTVSMRTSNSGWDFKIMEGANWPHLLWTLVFDEYVRITDSTSSYASAEFVNTTFVIFSDQDSQFGGFEDHQVALGSISCLNFWSRAYTESELTEFSDCLSEGDVFSLKPGVVTLHGGISENYVPPVTTTQLTTTTRALTTTTSTTTTNTRGICLSLITTSSYSSLTDYKGQKPAIGYTLTNDKATKDNWAGSYLNFPVRDLTLCFWYKFTDLSDRRQDHNILSAATATEAHIFYIRFYTRVSVLDFGWLGKILTVSDSFHPDVNVWTYYCLTLSMRISDSGWDFKMMEGANWPRLLWTLIYGTYIKSYGFPSYFNSTVSINTTFVIFSEQSSPFGGFSDNKVALGSISCLNFWSRAYTENELTEFSDCLSEGDVFSLKPGVVTLHGGISEEYVPPVTTIQLITTTTRGMPITVTATNTTTSSLMPLFAQFFAETPWNGWQKFRKIPEVWKSGLFEYEFKVPSPLACVSICLINHCKEINYCIEDGICEMGWGNTTGTLSNYAGAVYYVLE
ncbi:hypothetical protein EB796_007766 [Bugula neritina]|uniref:Pentraxin (PTX) domain-containing protein n=1 Tax=Bugula neritina TaxID=10212 RepID=A0A7J7K6V8_BUGNE|nr:hypothetical protein EB796_007766 [Bugula neritina]